MLNGGKTTFLLLFAAALHEAAHVAAIILCGGKIKRFDIEFLCGKITYNPQNVSVQSEIIIALSGIAINAAVAAAVIPFYNYTESAYALFFAVANIAIAFINIIPVKGLDGYNALFYMLLLKHDTLVAENVISGISTAALIALILICITSIIYFSFNASLLLTFALVLLLLDK